MDKKTQGKKNRESGARFERKVRKDLESKGWVVDRWTNNVELPTTIVSADVKESFRIENNGKLIPAKSRFNLRTTGFPDFISFIKQETINHKKFKADKNVYEVMGVECKSNSYLTKEEKKKCKWYIKNNTFSKILIASKGKKRGTIEYKEFENGK